METEIAKNSLEDKLILAYYLDVRHLDNNDVAEFMYKVMDNIKLETPIIGEIIALPVKGETRVECINPKYITEPELIREHRLKMDELHEIIEKFIKDYEDGRKKELE